MKYPRWSLPVSFPLRLTIRGFFSSQKWRANEGSEGTPLEESCEKVCVSLYVYIHHTMMITWVRGTNYLGGVKGAGCMKSEATSRSAASSRISSNRNWDANQRLARRHTTPKHPYCCWNLTCNKSYIYLYKPFAKTRMSVFCMFMYMLYPCKVLVRTGLCRVSSSSAWASALSL